MVPDPTVVHLCSARLRVSATVLQQLLDPFFNNANSGDDYHVCAEMLKSRDFVGRLSEGDRRRNCRAYRETANLEF
jgi:hypothetical protein